MIDNLEFTERGFKVEFLNVELIPSSSFSRKMCFIVKVDGIPFKIESSESAEMIQDLASRFGSIAQCNIPQSPAPGIRRAIPMPIESYLIDLIKEEAVSGYINNPKYVRRVKIEKIKNKYESKSCK
jgi:hypothetical protein